jgi:hypothetical protein
MMPLTGWDEVPHNQLGRLVDTWLTLRASITACLPAMCCPMLISLSPLALAAACSHTTRGLDMLEEALRHTPTLTELYSARSTLLRHAGDLEGT